MLSDNDESIGVAVYIEKVLGHGDGHDDEAGTVAYAREIKGLDTLWFAIHNACSDTCLKVDMTMVRMSISWGSTLVLVNSSSRTTMKFSSRSILKLEFKSSSTNNRRWTSCSSRSFDEELKL